MIIIVEGVDASGKDTFIDNLVKLTGFKKIRGSSFELAQRGPDDMYNHWKTILDSKEDLIVNRFFYSNSVYGPMYDYPTLSIEQFKELHKLVNENAILYFINADTDVLMERINERGDNMVDMEDVKDLQAGYELMWSLAKPDRLIRIDSTDNSLIDIDSRLYQRVVQYNANLDEMIQKQKELNGMEKE